MTENTKADWQTIETAPRDGTVFLAWWPSAVDPQGYKQPVKFDPIKGWVVNWDHDQIDPHMWMTMPSAPKGARIALK